MLHGCVGLKIVPLTHGTGKGRSNMSGHPTLGPMPVGSVGIASLKTGKVEGNFPATPVSRTMATASGRSGI
jgi:hypothetical protein